MGKWARGDKAKGQCDRCGDVVKHNSLRNQVVAGRLTNLWVCADCLDDDQPQWQVRFLRVDDAIALRNPRPFRGVDITLPNPMTFDINQPYPEQQDIPEKDV